MKKGILFIMFFVSIVFQSEAQKTYKYEEVPNDPMKMRIYTLDNGLKVYLSVYKNAPRIQTMIAVKTGSKNDPHTNTGLSHYLEHLMFKGTDEFGSIDYSKEKPLLDKIEAMYEEYSKLTDTVARKKMYHKIDSVSGLAAKYAIANEYDKMVSIIGAKGTNAWTSNEATVYINDIPSNQIERWLTIESERFRDPVFRLFHTELETVYEEKNISLDNDDSKLWENLYGGLFQKHPYGTQTTIGEVEHLKNPSIKTIKNYYQQRYVPNNMAIIMAGDFDPDKLIASIDKYWGKMAKQEVKPFPTYTETPIEKPIVKNVYGPDAEQMMFGYRLKGANTHESYIAVMMSMILNNATAGLIDLNLKQAQKVLDAGCFVDQMTDYGAFVFYGRPKEGQTMEQVKDLLIEQINKIKKGEFPEWLMTAIINDFKKSEIQMLENNMSRTYTAVDAFTKGTPWVDAVKGIEILSKITKQEIIDFANKNFNNNYVVVYKNVGEQKDVKKVTKPQLTPVEMNRIDESAFCKNIKSMTISPIEPVFLDFSKDITKLKGPAGVEILYNKNTENQRFSMYYVFEMGKNHDKKLDIAISYLQYLGTSKYTPVKFQEEMYKIGCSFNVFNSYDQVYVMLTGLNDNMDQGMALFESLLADAQINNEALSNMVNDILKNRQDDKLSKRTILWSAMSSFGTYGKKSPFTDILSENELKNIKAEELISIIRNLNSYQHRILYYGPLNSDQTTQMINKNHKVPAQLKEIPQETAFTELETKENKIYVVDYDMKQIEILMLSKSEKYNKSNQPTIRIFNEYFGSGMYSVVFQNIRESRALAYSAFASYTSPNKLDKSSYIQAYLGTQVDKVSEAMNALYDMFNNMPESEKALDASKEAIIEKIRTERILRESILFSYLNAQKKQIDYDLRKDVYAQIPDMNVVNLKDFHQKYIKDKKFTILVLGKKQDIDLKVLEKYGTVEFLTLEDIFGY